MACVGVRLDIASKINSASSTVKASVVTDATGTRLVMRGTTGAANTFTVTTDDGDGDNTDASGLSALAYDPSSSVTQMRWPMASPTGWCVRYDVPRSPVAAPATHRP